MNFYLASRYSRHPEMRAIRAIIEQGKAHHVTSRWIDQHGGRDQLGPHESSFAMGQLNDFPEDCAPLALADLADVATADVVVSFTDQPGGKGGRHVEFGYGYALDKIMVVVGPREHIFHTLPGVIVCKDQAAFWLWLASVSLGAKVQQLIADSPFVKGLQVGGSGNVPHNIRVPR